MSGKGSGRRPEQNVGDYATGWDRIFARVLTERAAIFTALTFASIEEAQAAAEVENMAKGYGPFN